jgi:sensor histidine kinase YesM
MKFFERYQIWLHLIGWVIFAGLPFLTLPHFIWNRVDLFSIGMAQLLTTVLIASFFYLNLHLLTPRLLQTHKTRRFLLILAVMLVSVALVKMLSFYAFPPGVRLPGITVSPRPNGPQIPWQGMLSSILSLGFTLTVSSFVALFRFHLRSQEQQQQIMLEKVSAELAVLKLQVSPHFLFNTLNNIRWLARQKSDQTEAAVVTLAQLLRYMIYQARQDRVSLRQEVDHIKHYIDLQKMRLTEIHTVTFRCEGLVDAYQIEPLLFIPFVENAFKYGLHSQRGGHIQIDLQVNSETLTFRTENPIFAPTGATNSSSELDSGIGIANIQKRLQLHYPNQHSLSITQADQQFRVALTLYLHHDQVALHRY